MKFAREIAGLGITAVVLSQCGCSASSFRTLFAKNQRSEFHTIEELDAKKSAPSAESAAASGAAGTKTASWNPFKRESQATPPATTPETTTAAAQSGFWKNPFGGDPDRVTDPFLPAGKDAAKKTDEVRTAAADDEDQDASDRDNRIARIAGVRDDEVDKDAEDAEAAPEISARPRNNKDNASLQGADELEVAEPLIRDTGERAVADRRAELERQKIVQLEELLASGNFRKTARTTREAVTKAGASAEARANRTKEAVVAKSQEARELAQAETSERIAEIDDFFEELEEHGNRAAEDMTESALELAESDESRPAQPKKKSSAPATQTASTPRVVRAGKRIERPVVSEDTEESSDHSSELFEDTMASSRTVKADSEESAQLSSTEENVSDNSDFQWQASRPTVKKAAGVGVSKSVRQVALMDESTSATMTPEKDQWLEDEVFAPTAAVKAPAPEKAVPKVRNVSGKTGKARQPLVADPFVSGEMETDSEAAPALVPGPGVRPEPDDRRGSVVPEVTLPDDTSAASPAQAQTADPAKGLSARSWIAIAAGLTIVGLLFLPNRRRTVGPVTAGASLTAQTF